MLFLRKAAARVLRSSSVRRLVPAALFLALVGGLIGVTTTTAEAKMTTGKQIAQLSQRRVWSSHRIRQFVGKTYVGVRDGKSVTGMSVTRTHGRRFSAWIVKTGIVKGHRRVIGKKLFRNVVRVTDVVPQFPDREYHWRVWFAGPRATRLPFYTTLVGAGQ